MSKLSTGVSWDTTKKPVPGVDGCPCLINSFLQDVPTAERNPGAHLCLWRHLSGQDGRHFPRRDLQYEAMEQVVPSWTRVLRLQLRRVQLASHPAICACQGGCVGRTRGAFCEGSMLFIHALVNDFMDASHSQWRRPGIHRSMRTWHRGPHRKAIKTRCSRWRRTILPWRDGRGLVWPDRMCVMGTGIPSSR